MQVTNDVIQLYAQVMPCSDPIIKSLMVQAEFSDVVKLGQIKTDDALVTTLVERWRPESHAFHLLVGECTITLKDVSLQLGLRIDGKLVIGSTGVVHLKNALVGSTPKLKWLKENMLTLLVKPTPQNLPVHCRAYILGLISRVLMSNKSGNIVHLMYLPLLVDLDWASWCSWVSTCLSHLYRKMCRTVYPTSLIMEGCTMLL